MSSNCSTSDGKFENDKFIYSVVVVSVSYGNGSLYLSNDFEGSNFTDASCKESFLRSIEVVRATRVIEANTSKIDPSLAPKEIRVVFYSPPDEITNYILISLKVFSFVR